VAEIIALFIGLRHAFACDIQRREPDPQELIACCSPLWYGHGGSIPTTWIGRGNRTTFKNGLTAVIDQRMSRDGGDHHPIAAG